MIQGLLQESDIPSILKRSGGFDAPEFLAAGPRDVLVSSDLEQKARRLLADTLTESEDEERRSWATKPVSPAAVRRPKLRPVVSHSGSRWPSSAP